MILPYFLSIIKTKISHEWGESSTCISEINNWIVKRYLKLSHLK
jgi:hypothetical protein